MASDGEPLSAQVILRDPAAAPAVVEFFRGSGFETGSVIGTSFAISGPPARFDTTFGDAATRLAKAGAPAELPLDAVPDELAASVEAVAIQGPPDFGPTSH